MTKALHGWRQIGAEVGIIVVGVLIALVAQQVVESIHEDAQVREFRHATDDELAYDLGVYQQRISFAPCVRARRRRADDRRRAHVRPADP